MNIEQDIIGIIQKKLKAGDLVTRATKLKEIDIDSLDVVEIVFEIEEKFDVSLPQDNAQIESANVEDLIVWVTALTSGKKSPPAKATSKPKSVAKPAAKAAGTPALKQKPSARTKAASRP